ncbi:GNAT family N-acetyltransferase [Nakamurella aerolata]|uniref:GNAT family N-acetyltransferase n=1 Tax=Nakamurella aerolata TaxID=1656892 RepID=A0A849AC17_9ACTN|nr:GNAT family protein [Nakamurella aerolata]NNG36691.1 GNAT family N-acetyltransferase [Nakamurella aerolata]
MKSQRCRLDWPVEDEYELIESWLRPTSTAAGLTGDTAEIVTAKAIRDINESGQVRYLMVKDAAGSPVGVVNYRRLNIAAGSFSIGGAIGETTLWGSGIGFEALRLLVDHLFHGENAHRVEFVTAGYNRHTLGMLTKGGFVLEGVLRDYHYLDGSYHHRTVWSILRDEFERSVAEYGERYPIHDVVPADDKRTAELALVRYLATHPSTSFDRVAMVSTGMAQ